MRNAVTDRSQWNMKKTCTPSLSLFLCLLLLAGLLCPRELHAAPFIRGDVDGNGSLEITDPVRLLGFLFWGSPPQIGCIEPWRWGWREPPLLERLISATHPVLAVTRSSSSGGIASPAPFLALYSAATLTLWVASSRFLEKHRAQDR
jgi:hypothetical protein